MPVYPYLPHTFTVSDLLKRPAFMARALALLSRQRFVADIIFAHGTPDQVAGGAAMFQRSESLFLDRDAQEVGVRAEFPRSGWTEQVFQAFVRQYGLEVPINDLSRRRNQIDQVQRALVKLANNMVRFVDRQAMQLLTTDPGVQSFAGSGSWAIQATDKVHDIAWAQKLIEDQDQGYVGDTLILHTDQEFELLIDDHIANRMSRESTQSTIMTGRMMPILGLRYVLRTRQITAGTAIVLNSKMVGTIADEVPTADEGYQTYNPGPNTAPDLNAPGTANPPDSDLPPIYTKIYRQDETSDSVIRGARWPAMWLTDPKSAVLITGIA